MSDPRTQAESAPGDAGAGALRLYLVRHGEVPSNTRMRYVGERDEPLTAEGRRQARSLARLFAELPVATVRTSPLRRCRETASAIAAAAGANLAAEARLAEQSFGAWEGLTREQVRTRRPAWRDHLARWEADPEVAPPGGESLASVQRRVLDAVLELRATNPGGAIVLVSHVGPVKALLCAAMGVPLTAARRLFLDPATISLVDWGERPIVRLFNAHGHLGWGQARWLR